ncbi:zinc transporter 6-A-like [Liolophura sinensis]|uniref:zinc transporter 6-A-like n=1 Tax=Liolophura sinensis TaxID=3198878 RepID=UPI003158E684
MSAFNKIPDLISSSVTTGVQGGDFTSGNSDLRLRSGTMGERTKYYTSGTIYPFMTTRSFPRLFWRELRNVAKEDEAKKILMFTCVNVMGTILLLLWCHTSDSMALTAYTYLTIFDIFSLLTCLLSVWVQKQKPTPQFSFGYERFEVLAVFASTTLSQLGSFFILKESVERLLQQPEVHIGRLLVGTILAFVLHMVLTYGVKNRAMNHVIAASGSSWLQEHMTDISESLCHVIPGLSKLLLPRINPFALIAFAGGLAQVVAYILIDSKNYHVADTWAAMSIAFMILGTMFPMSVYTGKILLQTTPAHVIGQLDKLLREATTLDGVLEFRHEHFWTLSFGTLAGSVQVRVRRDADEQLVLAHVHNRLSNLVAVLTIQIFKDDWSRGSTYQMFGQSNFTSPPGSGVSSPRATSPSLDADFSVQGLSPYKGFSPVPFHSGALQTSSGLSGSVLSQAPSLAMSGGANSVYRTAGVNPASYKSSGSFFPVGGASFSPASLHTPSAPPRPVDAFEAWKTDHSPEGHSHQDRSPSSHGHSHDHSHGSPGHSH